MYLKKTKQKYSPSKNLTTLDFLKWIKFWQSSVTCVYLLTYLFQNIFVLTCLEKISM